MKRYHPLPLLLIFLFNANAPVRAFEDPTAQNNRLLFEYIDRVSETVDKDAFDRIPFSTMMSLVRRLGQIERYNLSPEAFFDYVGKAVAVREAFEFEVGLSDAEFEEYVLPLRIRYESTAQYHWRSFLHQEFAGQTAGLDVNSAAEKVLKTIMERVTLVGESTYTLTSRGGDLDPLTTWRGRRADEVDMSILTCAALRSIGIPARLIYTPQIRGSRGGKIWLEYMNPDKTWQAWAPSLVKTVGWGDHRQALSAFLAGRAGVLFANPASPTEITDQYVNSRRFVFPAPTPVAEGGPEAVEKLIEYTLAFEVDNLHQPIRGMELVSIRSIHRERTIASDRFWSFIVEDDIKIQGKAH